MIPFYSYTCKTEPTLKVVWLRQIIVKSTRVAISFLDKSKKLMTMHVNFMATCNFAIIHRFSRWSRNRTPGSVKYLFYGTPQKQAKIALSLVLIDACALKMFYHMITLQVTLTINRTYPVVFLRTRSFERQAHF